MPGLAEAIDSVNPGIYYAGVQQLLADPARSGVLYGIAVTGTTLGVVAVPDAMRNVLSMAADQRRPDRIALLVSRFPRECEGEVQSSTLTSVDGGATWQRVADPCHGPRYEKLAIAPNGSLWRWSNYDPAVVTQVLDGWP